MSSRIMLQISLGILLIVATGAILLAWGFNEENRMAAYARAEVAQNIEVGAALFDQQCSRCHGKQGLGVPGLCPPLNDRHFFDERLREVGWSGTHEDYIVATASSGRLVSTRPELYPGNGTMPAMPSFSDQSGGPLREDQIRAIAAYIMNWSETATDVSGAPVAAPEVDIAQPLPEGDPANGEALTTSLGCTACHILAVVGPPWLATADEPGVATRASERIQDPAYTGQAETPEQYLLESIIHPDVFKTPGFENAVMPAFPSQTEQEYADLIAYLMTLE